MNRLLLKVISVLSLLLLLTNCREKAWNDYYSRPGWLAGPIYQQLKSKGSFTLYIACLERAKYADVLGRTGSFTLFAPNDSAFNIFLKENGYSSVNDLDSLTVHKIVEYSIINNGYSKVQLAAYQDAGLGSWGQDMAFKRKSFYKGYYTDPNFAGWVFDRNGLPVNTPAGSKIIYNSSQKYVPYFIQSYLTKNGLSEYDYHYFYPNADYAGFNVADAKVIQADIISENGYINEVNKVVLPLPSLDEYLASQSNYGVFKGIMDRFAGLYYDSVATISYSNSNEAVYQKYYSNSLTFNPCAETVNPLIENLSQELGWTAVIPNNTTLNQFINSRLLKYYTSIDQIYDNNFQILADFLNAHILLSKPPVWPKNLSTLSASVSEAKLCSNAFFYGINAIMDHDFNTVFSELYLNPANRIMTEWIKAQPSLKEELLGKNIKTKTNYTVFIPSDSAVLPLLRAKGFIYDKFNYVLQKRDSKGNLVVAWDDPDASNLFLLHIVASNISNVSETAFYPTLSGEYVAINNNTAFSAGNNEKNETLTCSSPMSENNGTAYSLINDKYLKVPTRSAGWYLASKSQYSAFFSYLQKSSLFNASDSTIKTVLPGTYYTFLIPNDNAIAAAGLPSPTATDDASLAIIKKFLLYHIIPNEIIFTDGKVTGELKTQAQTNPSGAPVYATVNISAAGNTIQIMDKMGNTANFLSGSNNIASLSAIHLIDRVLKFE
jgi:uncharacterized surface protein with fasciclin (FAS1) repeats